MSIAVTKDTSYQSIYISQIGHDLNPDLADKILIKEKGAIRYRDAYYLKFLAGEAWLFEYGILVCWNLSLEDRQQLALELKDIMLEQTVGSFSEQYRYRIDTSQSFKVQHDVLELPTDDMLCRLALSHAFAQSTKLSFFEEKALEVIQKNVFLSKRLAATGNIPLSRRELAKLRGVLFDTSSGITLHFNLLDTPEFFWDYPEQEVYYESLAKYLDLNPRINILNKKLYTIHQLLEMLAAEQHHKHSSFLEWIIIILISVEILMYFLE